MMEIETYKMQYSYDGSFPGNLRGKGLRGIDEYSVGGIVNNGTPVYPFINQYANKLKRIINSQKNKR